MESRIFILSRPPTGFATEKNNLHNDPAALLSQRLSKVIVFALLNKNPFCLHDFLSVFGAERFLSSFSVSSDHRTLSLSL